SPAPSGPHHHPPTLERVQGLAERHPTHADALRQLPLRRQPVSGPQLARHDGLGQSLLDLCVCRRALTVKPAQHPPERGAHLAPRPTPGRGPLPIPFACRLVTPSSSRPPREG